MKWLTKQLWARILFSVVLICGFAVHSASGQIRRARNNAAATPSPSPSPTPTPAAPVIPTPEVASAAIQLNQRLRSLPERLAPGAGVAQLEQQLNELKQTTGEQSRETELAIQSGAVFTDLQQSSIDWQELSKRAAAIAETLTTQATAVDNEIRSLKNEQSRWQATNDQIRAQELPAPELIDLTGKAVADIGVSIKQLEERRTQLVALQQTVAAQSAIIATESEHLKGAMAEAQQGLLEVDSPPLWMVQFTSRTEDSAARRLLRGSTTEDLLRVATFIRAKRIGIVVVAILTLIILSFLMRLRSVGEKKAVDLQDPGSILNRPVSLGLLIFLVAMMPLLFAAPLSVVGVANLIAVIPMMTLLRPRLTKPSQWMLLVLVASVLLWHLIKFLQVTTWFKRDLFALLTLGVIAAFVWFMRDAHRAGTQPRPIVSIAMYTAVALLAVAFLANVFGYVRLSDLLTQGTLVSAYRGLALYTIVVIGSLIISFALNAKPAQRFAVLVTDRDRLARRLVFALAVVTLLLWFHTTLNLFAIRDVVYGALSRALNYQITIGSASFAVSNIVAFVLTLFFGYLVASVTRAILGEGILPRLKLARGLPNAIATITHYVLLVLIFLLALAAAGVELSKFTILTGAFGVGLGFGLQNVVNNFVSGLILLFERPIRVGDFLEIKGVSGEVTKIGFRSSTVHAFDGSDLIIPNATLISEQVTNWTLTGTRRQAQLHVHVAYGNDPTKVRDLLRETVTSHSEVLKFPAPTALFIGFGDSALNFELRFWAPRPEVVAELKSDVALSIAAALQEAGITVPIPQRHLHITGLNENDRLEKVLSQDEVTGDGVD
ncbi:MAG TPA: mechanosensitive ion channel domain-containing protein [Pyrinomonadaceae bacterium]|nr:mechanosensitive ion channel domain-containing protein [Pyrinomonadaceae bacterium]